MGGRDEWPESYIDFNGYLARIIDVNLRNTFKTFNFIQLSIN
jgi:hypothetical protein